MKLDKWLSLNGVTGSRLAADWKTVPAVVSRIVNGLRRPTFEFMVRAYVTTGGAVSLRDWIEQHLDELRREGIVPKDWEP